ncbi:hypothetical protein V5F63_19020 [Xanthobacter autotrophicus DSM 597]|uniref:hypothetical protein n=1 Tax=Xanthobacter wiegelii TaxID=3119913 RepID=UPI0037267E6A
MSLATSSGRRGLRYPPRHSAAPVTRSLPTARLINASLAFIYVFILWLNYRDFISPAFRYMSFVYYEHDPFFLLIDSVLVAIAAAAISPNFNKPSDYAITLIFTIVFIPGMLLTTFATSEVTSDHIALKLVMLVSLLYVNALAGIQIKLKMPAIKWPPGIFILMIVGLAGICVLALSLTYGFKLQMHALTEVYEQRDQFKEGLADASYNRIFLGMAANVLCPILISYGLANRSYHYSFIGAGLAFYIFSISGLKSSLLSTIYVIATFVLISYFAKNAVRMVLVGVISLSVIGMLASGTSLELLNDLFVRRTFIIQGLLTEFYFSYALDNVFLYWSHSILSAFFDAAIVANPDDTIGALFFPGQTVHANASLWSDGFLNAGFPGIFLSATVVGLFFSAVNYCTQRTNLTLACSAFAMLFMMTCQTGIVKVVGMHGGLIACVLFLIGDFRNARQQSQKPSGRGSVS